VSAVGVTLREQIPGYDDIAETVDGTFITCKIDGATVTISELSTALVTLHTRSVTFSTLSTLTTAYTSLNFVRYQPMHYADQQEFVLKTGQQVFFLKEAAAAQVQLKYSNLTNYTITATGSYTFGGLSFVVFGTQDQKIFSVDQYGNYKYPDGSGLGLGPHDNGVALAGTGGLVGAVTNILQYGTWLIVTSSVYLASYDGAAWKNWNGTGTGTGINISANNTVLNNTITAAAVVGTRLVLGSSNGGIGYYDSITARWTNYNAPGAGTTSLANNGTAISGNSIYTITDLSSNTAIPVLVKLADPGTMPAGTQATAAAFSQSTTYLAVGSQATPFVTIYKRSGDTFTKLTNPLTLPAGQVYGLSWSDSDSYLACAHATTPFVTIYKRSGDTFTKLADPVVLPVTQGTGCSFSPGNVYLGVSCTGAPYYRIYSRSGDTFTAMTTAVVTPTGAASGIDFSTDPTFPTNNSYPVTISHATTPFMTTYFLVAGVWTKQTDPGTLPVTAGTCVKYDNGGRWLMVGCTGAPFLREYQVQNGGYFYASNFIVAPGNAVNALDRLPYAVQSWASIGFFMATATTPFELISVGITGYNLPNVVTPPSISAGLAAAVSSSGTYFALGGTGATTLYIYKATATTSIVVAGAGGRIASYDGYNWKNYDGSGAGTGPSTYSAGPPGTPATIINSQDINAMQSYGNLSFGANTGLMATFLGWAFGWYSYNSAGTGINIPANNQTVVGTDAIASFFVSGGRLFVVSNNGKMGSMSIAASTWINYNAAIPTIQPYDAGTHSGGADISDSVIFGTTVVFSTLVGRVFSYDGSAWKNYDGTGTGTGPWNAGVGHQIFTSNVFGAYYIVAGESGKLTSWDGANWKYSDGTGTGTGPFNNGTATGLDHPGIGIGTMTTFGTKLVVGACDYNNTSSYNRIASWDGANWKNWDGTGTGTGPYSNGTSLFGNTFDVMTTLTTYLTFLIVWGGETMSSWDGANWKYWNGTGTGTGPFTNVGVVPHPGSGFSWGATRTAYTWGSYLVVSSPGFGGVGSWDGSNWKNYDATGTGTGPFDNQISSSAFILSYSTYLIVSGVTGKVRSWDGANWKYSDGTGTGTGPWSNGAPINQVGQGGASTLGSKLIISGSGGYIANWNGSIWTPYSATFSAAGPFKNSLGALDYGVAGKTAVLGSRILFAGNVLTSALNNATVVGNNAIFSYDPVAETFEQVYTKKNVPMSYFNWQLPSNSINSPIVFQYNQYLIYAAGNNLASFDGTDWAYPSGGANSPPTLLGGTVNGGVGTGPWGSTAACGGGGTTLVAAGIMANGKNIFTGKSYNNWLVVAGGAAINASAATDGMVSSFDPVNGWKTYAGTGTGLGPYNSGASANWSGQPITCMELYNNNLYFAGGAGNVNYYTYSGGAIAQASVTTPIGANNVYTMCIYTYPTAPAGSPNSTVLWVGGAAGLGGYLSAASWHAYNEAGTGVTTPACNANVVGANAVYTATQYGSYLMVGAVTGLMASFDAVNWVNSSGVGNGLGPWASLAACGKNTVAGVVNTQLAYSPISASATNSDITGLTSYCGNVIVSGSGGNYVGGIVVYIGAIASFDGSQWRAANGGGVGTGPYGIGISTNNATKYYSWGATIVYNNTLYSEQAYTPYIVVQKSMLFPSAGILNQVILPQQKLAQVFAWKFENGYYLFGITNNTEGVFYRLSLDNELTALNGSYTLIQVSGGKSRAWVSSLPITYGTTLNAYGVTGYNDFNTFTNYVVFSSTFAPGATVLHSNIGLGYTDITFKDGRSATNIWEYSAPTYTTPQLTSINVYQSNTDTLIDAYGKLTNAFGLTPTVPYELRVLWTPTGQINGQGIQAALAAALTNTTGADNLGVLLTNIGEYDQDYIPHVVADNRILYQFNGQFQALALSESPINLIQQISEREYKLNTIYPFNIIDTISSTLELGSVDYNGRMYFTSTAAPTAGGWQMASILQGKYSNSVDVNFKTVTIASPVSTNYQVIGTAIAGSRTVTPKYGIDVYIGQVVGGAPVYWSTTLSDGSELPNPALAGAAYAFNDNLPFAIGFQYLNKAVITPISTIFMTSDYNTGPIYGVVNFYDGFLSGNEIQGQYTPFYLFAQDYLFDGDFIYRVEMTDGLVSGRSRIAIGSGLQYIASGPTDIFFLSSYDNSMWTFNGGAQLTKGQRFNKETVIQNGVYNVHDNGLLLQTPDEFLFILDKIITRNAKKVNQTNTILYTTTGGIVISNDTTKWRYTWQPLSGSTVVPFTWQSGYFGQMGNQKSIIGSIVLTFHSAAKEAMTVAGRVYTIDENGEKLQEVTWAINTNDWSTNGIVRRRLQPQQQRSLATSVGITANNKIVLLSAQLELKDDVAATVAPRASR
jgi:hypothetical protein